MFVWISSDSSRSGLGGCGLSFLMSMLLCMFSVSGNNSILLLLVLIGLFTFFMLPRLATAIDPVYGDADDEKRKNDEYLDKPKRDEQYIIGADGDILNVIDEEAPDYNQSRGDNRY